MGVLGKLMTLGFWGLWLANWLQPLAEPFAMLVGLGGLALLGLHVLTLLLSRPARRGVVAVLLTLLFGAFYRPRQEKHDTAVAADD